MWISFARRFFKSIVPYFLHRRYLLIGYNACMMCSRIVKLDRSFRRKWQTLFDVVQDKDSEMMSQSPLMNVHKIKIEMSPPFFWLVARLEYLSSWFWLFASNFLRWQEPTNTVCHSVTVYMGDGDIQRWWGHLNLLCNNQTSLNYFALRGGEGTKTSFLHTLALSHSCALAPLRCGGDTSTMHVVIKPVLKILHQNGEDTIPLRSRRGWRVHKAERAQEYKMVKGCTKVKEHNRVKQCKKVTDDMREKELNSTRRWKRAQEGERAQ